jgi:hypothetical protein
MLLIHGAVQRPDGVQLEAALTERLVGLLGQGIES